MSKIQLISEIKELQRSTPDAKQAWWDFCDAHLGGIRDPARHDASVLEEFLGMVQGTGSRSKGGRGGKGPSKGSMPARSAPSFGGKGGPVVGGRGAMPAFSQFQFAPAAAPMMMRGAPPGGAAGGPIDLVSFIKTGQRLSQHWKTAWQMYVRSQGSDWNDPAKHDDDFIVAFLDYIGECVEAQIQAGASSRPSSPASDRGSKGGGKVRSMKGGATNGAPPAKRQRKAAAPPANGKASLVERVKSFQRKDPESKELWWGFCDAEHNGVRDPARHPEEVLKEFLDAYDAENGPAEVEDEALKEELGGYEDEDDV